METKKQQKVYLPKWIAWLTAAIAVPLWLWISYWTFAEPDTNLFEWAVQSTVIIAAVVIVFLMGYGKLPAYIIVQSDENEDE
jgi:hypothetical protein